MGAVAIFVNGGLGHSPSGGWFTPTKTMFQLEPVHWFHSTFREIHCCCVPESTVPSMRLSESQPPDAQPCSWCNTRLPATCIRRRATACETAHCIVPAVGWTMKPSAERQKVQVALLRGSEASAWTLPETLTASGDAPS